MKKAIITLSVFIFVIETFLPRPLLAEPPRENFLHDVSGAVLTLLTNEERVQHNARPLSQNALLMKAAQLKANDMALRGYFSHTTPDGKTPWYFFDKVGYKYAYAGENLAVNYFSSEEIAEAWMNSPTHRANVLKKDFTEVGFGISTGIYNGRKTVYVTEFFGKPAKTSRFKKK